MKARPGRVWAGFVVLGAILLMVALGFWQLARARWKEGLLAEYRHSSSLPSVAIEAVDPRMPPLFRSIRAECARVEGWRQVATRNRTEQSGWGHVARCVTPGGQRFDVDVGWSARLDNPSWRGGPVAGVVAADGQSGYRIVASDAAPGFQPSAPPSMDAIPNNHRAYAVQWFLFAGVAGVIYAIARRRRTP